MGSQARSEGPQDRAVLAVQTFTVEVEADADVSAIGARVTVELCGHWEHSAPCRWPHRTTTRMPRPRSDRIGQARTAFAASVDQVPALRERMIAAVQTGQLEHQGKVIRWRLLDTHASEPTRSERDWGDRLLGNCAPSGEADPPARE